MQRRRTWSIVSGSELPINFNWEDIVPLANLVKLIKESQLLDSPTSHPKMNRLYRRYIQCELWVILGGWPCIAGRRMHIASSRLKALLPVLVSVDE